MDYTRGSRAGSQLALAQQRLEESGLGQGGCGGRGRTATTWDQVSVAHQVVSDRAFANIFVTTPPPAPSCLERVSRPVHHISCHLFVPPSRLLTFLIKC